MKTYIKDLLQAFLMILGYIIFPILHICFVLTVINSNVAFGVIAFFMPVLSELLMLGVLIYSYGIYGAMTITIVQWFVYSIAVFIATSVAVSLLDKRA